MQVHFDLDIDDLIAFNLHHYGYARNPVRGFWTAEINLHFNLILLVVFLVSQKWVIFYLLLFSFIQTVLLWFPSFTRWLIKKQVRKLYSKGQNKGVLGNHIIAIDADGLTEISDLAQQRILWSGIEKIEENEDYFFFYTGTMQAHVIPKKAFPHKEEASDFFRLSQKYKLEARQLER
jgi:hypothetical protein